MNKKILMFALLGMFLLSFASSSILQTSKLNEDFDFRVTCENIGYCDNSTICNINVESPNNTLLVAGQDMQHNPSYYNYTITPDELGIYSFTGFCKDGSLQEPIDFKLDVTFSGKENNIWAYIIALIVPILLLLGTIWLNRTYDKQARESLYKKLVIGFFNAKKSKNRVDFSSMMMYLLAYGILDMMFVLYYLDVMLLLFVFKDLVVSFGINTFTELLPNLIIASLWGLSLVGVFLMMKIANITLTVFSDLKDMMRGGID